MAAEQATDGEGKTPGALLADDIEAHVAPYLKKEKKSRVVQPIDAVPLWRKLVAEFVGSILLTATMVGSGIQGFELSNGNEAFALLAMSLATWAILFAIISVFDTVSRGHFNPIVTVAEALRLERPVKNVCGYIVVQVSGAICGCIFAHAMFHRQEAVSFGGADRTSGGRFLGELMVTFVLLVVNFGAGKQNIAMALALAVLAGYWYSSSQCFANPAVTIGRTFTDTFAGIAPESVPVYIAGQISGMFLALLFTHFIIDGRSATELCESREARRAAVPTD